MFDSTILEIGLGLVLVYFLMSLFCTALNEWIMRIFSQRAKTLKSGILHMLGGGETFTEGKIESEKGKNLANVIYNHPLISGLHRKGLWHTLFGWLGIKNPGPSNISNRNFALALLDSLLNSDISKQDDLVPVEGTADEFRVPKGLEVNVKNMLEKINQGIDSIGLPADVKKTLRTLLNSAGTKKNDAIAAFQTSIEQWFDDTMDRVTGWYKRKAQLIILALAIVASVGLNVDSFAIATSLSQDDALRASLVAAAEKRVEQPRDNDEETLLDHEEIQKEIESLGLPIGWTKDKDGSWEVPKTTLEWVIKVCGILLTAFLVALGSPFWFDTLNRVVNLRSSGNKPKKLDEQKAS